MSCACEEDGWVVVLVVEWVRFLYSCRSISARRLLGELVVLVSLGLWLVVVLDLEESSLLVREEDRESSVPIRLRSLAAASSLFRELSKSFPNKSSATSNR